MEEEYIYAAQEEHEWNGLQDGLHDEELPVSGALEFTRRRGPFFKPQHAATDDRHEYMMVVFR